MKNIVLVGFMGCGKSTLGKKLAKKLNVPFIDTDAEIEIQEKLTISEIFTQKGEEYFRKIEHDFLNQLKVRVGFSEDSFILSCGGGMPCYHENMKLLKEIGSCFYLKLSAIELTKRLSLAKSKRPLVVSKSNEELFHFIEDKLKERSEFYEQANFILNGKEQNPSSILEKLA